MGLGGCWSDFNNSMKLLRKYMRVLMIHLYLWVFGRSFMVFSTKSVMTLSCLDHATSSIICVIHGQTWSGGATIRFLIDDPAELTSHIYWVLPSARNTYGITSDWIPLRISGRTWTYHVVAYKIVGYYKMDNWHRTSVLFVLQNAWSLQNGCHDQKRLSTECIQKSWYGRFRKQNYFGVVTGPAGYWFSILVMFGCDIHFAGHQFHSPQNDTKWQVQVRP